MCVRPRRSVRPACGGGGSTTATATEFARVPDGHRLYVIGDIHGRADLLERLRDDIVADLCASPAERVSVVHLGDYVDRGPGSFEVLDLLIEEPLAGVESVHLRGNHEQMMLDFLDDPEEEVWLYNGGLATLASYGVPCQLPWVDRPEHDRLRDGLRAALPERHLRFLEGLRTLFVCGDYLCVHAGVRPDRPLGEQEERDLLWIREPFLGCDTWLGKCVVHGHSIAPEPEVRPHRIGIDTGAFFSGHLTCLVLEQDERRFLIT